MRTFTMTIDGSAAETLGTIGVVNPATGEIFAEAPDCTKAQLDLAMESAQKAFAGWKDDAEFRKHVMYECADAKTTFAQQSDRVRAGVAGGAGDQEQLVGVGHECRLSCRWMCVDPTAARLNRGMSNPRNIEDLKADDLRFADQIVPRVG